MVVAGRVESQNFIGAGSPRGPLIVWPHLGRGDFHHGAPSETSGYDPAVGPELPTPGEAPGWGLERSQEAPKVPASGCAPW